jgi:hypothetical protein
MNPHLIGTHMLLKSWGAWGKGIHLGIPTMSPMFGERALKTPLYADSDPNPELASLDGIICRLEPEHRTLVIQKYSNHWPTRQFLRHYHWSFNRYSLQLEQSLWAVRVRIDDNPLISINTRVIKYQTAKLSP